MSVRETQPQTLAGAVVILRHGLDVRDIYFVRGYDDMAANVLALLEPLSGGTA